MTMQPNLSHLTHELPAHLVQALEARLWKRLSDAGFVFECRVCTEPTTDVIDARLA